MKVADAASAEEEPSDKVCEAADASARFKSGGSILVPPCRKGDEQTKINMQTLMDYSPISHFYHWPLALAIVSQGVVVEIYYFIRSLYFSRRTVSVTYHLQLLLCSFGGLLESFRVILVGKQH